MGAIDHVAIFNIDRSIVHDDRSLDCDRMRRSIARKLPRSDSSPAGGRGAYCYRQAEVSM